LVLPSLTAESTEQVTADCQALVLVPTAGTGVPRADATASV